MKPIKTLLLLTCFCWLVTGAFGSPVDSKTAASTVAGWLRFDQKPLGKVLGAKIQNVETFRDNTGAPLYYAVNLEPSGFVIVPAEDQVEPIIAFAEKGHFDPSPTNPLGALISRDVPARVARARAKGVTPALLASGNASANKWQTLLQNASGGTIQPAGAVGSEISDLRVAPFIPTLWDQGALITIVSNNISITDTIWVTTHFTTNSLGDVSSTSLSITNSTGVFFIAPGWPIIHSFTGADAVDVTSGPDNTVTNTISVAATIQIIITNQFDDIITNVVLTGSGTATDVATGPTGGTVTHAVPINIVIPLVVSDMKACYNYFTPPHWGPENPRLFPPGRGNYDNDPCGCVATAMAQLMYYFQYPSTGVGTACYTFTVDGNPMGKNLLGGDFNGGPYKWNTMPLAPNYYSLTIAQAQAVGALTFDAGIAVHMQYSEGDSAAYMTDAKTALVNTFKYKNAVVNPVTNLDTGCFECSLYNMMNPNLDARLPVLLGITGDPGGHAIVVDGYGYSYGMLFHHLNMGWSGAYNAWYSLPIIDMYDFVPNSGTYTYFWDVTECIYNVYTNGSGEIISGRVSDSNTGSPIANASVTANRVGGGTYAAFTDANGIYAFAEVPSASTYLISVTNAGYNLASSNFTTTTSSDSGISSGNVWGADFTLVPASGSPVITVQPNDQIVDLGATATFSVAATGALPFTYQWQSCASGSTTWTNMIDGGNISGSGTATLTVNQVSNILNGQPFQCVVANSSGSATSSPPAVLILNIPSYLTITTLAGLAGNSGTNDGTNNNARFDNPRGIAVDNHTNVYVTDLYGHTVRMLMPAGTNWVVSTIAGLAGNSGTNDGTGSNARFNGPYGIAVGQNTNLYVADSGNNTIRMLTPSGTNWVVSTIAGLAGNSGTNNGTGSQIRFHYPIGIAVDQNTNVYVADEANSTIRMLTPSGTNWVASTIAGLAGAAGSADGTNSNARFSNPYGIAVDSSNNLYVVDNYSCIIRKISPAGVNWVVSTIAGLAYNTGSADGIGSSARFNNPAGIAVDPAGNLYVADAGNNAIRQIVLLGANWNVFTVAGIAGNPGSTDGTGSAALFNGPYGIAVDQNTNVYVADSGNNTIRGIPLDPVFTPAIIKTVNQLTGGTLNFAWSAMVGKTYQVQFKTNLNQTAWINLASVTASNWTGLASVPVGPDPQRFYRVVPTK